MNILIIALIYASILVYDFRKRRRKMSRGERIMYCTLAALALISAFPASVGLEFDTIGSSLSGMISLFMH